MTEDEAKTKWCHLTMPTDEYDRCEGSKCMAWRWTQRVTNQDEIDHQQFMVGFGLRPRAIYADTEHGYCGLAGKP